MKTQDEKDPANAADLAVIGAGLMVSSGAIVCSLLSWPAVAGYLAGAAMACVAGALLTSKTHV
jgi:hypothetical protein